MLDGHSAEAHTSLAHVRATQDWDFSGAESLFLRAIQLNPRYSTARHWYAMSCLVPMARLDEALEQILLAQSLDPVSSIIARDVAVTQYYRRDFDAALEQCDHTIELNPHFAPAYLTLGMIQEQRKDFDESAAAFRRAVDLAPNSVADAECAGADAGVVGEAGSRDRCAADAWRDGVSALRLPGRIHDAVIRRRRQRRGISLADQGRRRPLLRLAGAESRSAI